MLETKYRAADATDFAERLDLINSYAVNAVNLGTGWARLKERGGRWDEGKMINRNISKQLCISFCCLF